MKIKSINCITIYDIRPITGKYHANYHTQSDVEMWTLEINVTENCQMKKGKSTMSILCYQVFTLLSKSHLIMHI